LLPVADAVPALSFVGHASEHSRRTASATIYATTPLRRLTTACSGRANTAAFLNTIARARR
jgi:hypothetical protein